MDWSDPLLKSLDLEYHNLNPAKGLYYGLVAEGRVPRMTTDALIQIATEEAPKNTRAYGRSALVRYLLEGGGLPMQIELRTLMGYFLPM